MKIFQEIYRNIKHKHFLEKVNPFLACLVDEFQKFLRWLRHYCSLRFHIPQRLKLYKNKHYRVQRKKQPPSLSILPLFRWFSYAIFQIFDRTSQKQVCSCKIGVYSDCQNLKKAEKIV